MRLCILLLFFFYYFSFNPGYTDALTYKGHKNYVSAVCFIEGNPSLIITGGNDSLICVYNTNEIEPFITAKGHSNTGILVFVTFCLVFKR